MNFLLEAGCTIIVWGVIIAGGTLAWHLYYKDKVEDYFIKQHRKRK
jgi:hypothetical protein